MAWKEIWRRKASQPPKSPTPDDLMILDGYDTGAGRTDYQSMAAFSDRCGNRLKIGKEARLLEVGCGAGAWLLDFHHKGVRVFGADYSIGHLGVANEVMPSGGFAAAEAIQLPFQNHSFDAVCAGSCFGYFPDENDAEIALKELIRVLRPGGIGVVTDIPDLALREKHEGLRRNALGDAEYERLYGDLPHRHFDRKQMCNLAQDQGVSADTTTQNIAGYANSPYRFNLWFEKP